jgi:streptomycin 6-kinase
VDFSSPTVEATRGRLLARFGTLVEPWWARVPAILTELADRWDLVIGDAVGRGSTSLVIRCQSADGRPAVLKLVPDANVVAGEASALRSWAPSGRVPLVWGYDPAEGALLLEAIPSEIPLLELGTAKPSDDIANLIRDLHRSGAPMVRGGVVSLAERVDFIFGHWVARHASRGELVSRAVPVKRLRRGHDLARALVADAAVPVLLHGDLHPGNVLDRGGARGLVAIDPRPCVGDAVFDAIDWVFWGVDDPRDWQRHGRELALALGVEHERLSAWCAALARMLAAAQASRGASADVVEALLALAP